MAFVKVASVSDMPPGKMKAFAVGEKSVLVANLDGKFYAIGNTCTHAGGDLSLGKLEGNVVTCPRHGSRFDLTNGKAISGPKIGFLKLKTKDELVYEVKIEGSEIYIRAD